MKGRLSKNFRHALAEAHQVDEVKTIRNKAVALAADARQAQDREMVYWANEIKLRAERRSGQLLNDLAKTHQRQRRGRPKKNSVGDEILLSKQINEFGITHNQSADWQQLAAMPDDDFEQRLVRGKRDLSMMTTKRMRRPVPRPSAFAL